MQTPGSCLERKPSPTCESARALGKNSEFAYCGPNKTVAVHAACDTDNAQSAPTGPFDARERRHWTLLIHADAWFRAALAICAVSCVWTPQAHAALIRGHRPRRQGEFFAESFSSGQISSCTARREAMLIVPVLVSTRRIRIRCV